MAASAHAGTHSAQPFSLWMDGMLAHSLTQRKIPTPSQFIPQNLNECGADLSVRHLQTVINPNPWKRQRGWRGVCPSLLKSLTQRHGWDSSCETKYPIMRLFPERTETLQLCRSSANNIQGMELFSVACCDRVWCLNSRVSSLKTRTEWVEMC